MDIGPPPGRSSRRLLAARTLTALSFDDDQHELDSMMAHRVKSLRNRVELGTYRVDPNRLAASIYEAMIAGGL